jgi:hypothetical protein
MSDISTITCPYSAEQINHWMMMMMRRRIMMMNCTDEYDGYVSTYLMNNSVAMLMIDLT